jgi:hypothetical protein
MRQISLRYVVKQGTNKGSETLAIELAQLVQLLTELRCNLRVQRIDLQVLVKRNVHFEGLTPQLPRQLCR